jgi:hypothetical protein
MDKAGLSSPTDRVQSASDNTVASPFNGHDLLTQPDLYRAAAGATPSTAGSYLPAMEVAEFKSDAAEVLTRVAPDHGEHISTADLAKLVEDPAVKGHDAVIVATLYDLAVNPYDTGATASTPVWGIGSVADITSIPTATAAENKLVTENNQLQQALSWNNWAKADKNQDGMLSPAEIKQNPLYANLVKQFPDLAPTESSPLQGLTPTMIHNEASKTSAQISITENAFYIDGLLQQRIANAPTSALYADSKTPLNSIKMEDVHQGINGDCYFEATLAETAAQNPAIIRDAIKTNTDGSYTVTFKGDPQRPVTVPEPTQGELALYNGGSADGLWPAVMEKAYAQYAVDVLKVPTNGLTNEDAITGGDPYSVMQLVTGQSVDRIRVLQPTATSADGSEIVNPKNAKAMEVHTAQQITAALSSGRLAVVGILPSPEAEQAGLIDDHAYSLVGYQPGKNGGEVTLRNPWGTFDNPHGDIKQISLDALFTMTSSIDVETNSAMQKTKVSGGA